MATARRHPFTLRFTDNALEKEFLADYVRKSMRTIRYGIAIGVVIYSVLFGFMDWLRQTEALIPIIGIRSFVFVCAVGVLAATFLDRFPRYMQITVSGLALLAGVGLMAMIPLDTTPDAYLDGPVFFLLPIYVLLRLRFIYASVVGFILVAIYCGIILLLESLQSAELWGYILFVFSSNMIGMVAGYALENYARKDFIQARILDKERQKNADLLNVKNKFFANISHEIRTPLTLILGPLEDRLRQHDEALVSFKRQTVDAMKHNGNRLLSFLNQLLELSRLDAEHVPLKYQEGDIGAFLKSIIASFQPYAEAQSITLNDAVEEPVKGFITDFEKLEIIIANLISNAIKYTQKGGKVRVTATHVENQGIKISVRDNGPGMTPEDRAHIFDRFYRSPTVEATQASGLGIGLSLTQALVGQLKGHISVESELDYGTTFIIELPLLQIPSNAIQSLQFSEREGAEGRIEKAFLQAEGDPTWPAGATSNHTVPKRGHVLVVDDHSDVRAYIASCLEDHYAVVSRGSGSEGLAWMKEHPPDVVIVDLMMPGMSGIDFLRHVRGEVTLSHIPVIMLTASTVLEDRIAGLEAGADDFVTKPFDKNELLFRVQNLVMRQKAMRNTYQRLVGMEPQVEEVVSSETVFLEKLRDVINEQLANEHFNVDALAEALGMSVRQLQRKTKSLTGVTPAMHIRTMRLKKSKLLLEGGFGTVSDVAYAVGFSNPTYFTKRFRELYDTTPSEWITKTKGKDHVKGEEAVKDRIEVK